MKIVKLLIVTLGLFIANNTTYATSLSLKATFEQVAPPDSIINGVFLNWHHLDAKQDNTIGVSSIKAYKELLKNKKSETIIVAVIDSGIDIEHEDLKDVIWVNSDEIAGNGIDDDKNGYIDDMHGWNFIGGKDGSQVQYDTLELTRLYAKYKNMFDGKTASSIAANEKEEYESYQKIKKIFEKKLKEKKKSLEEFETFASMVRKAEKDIEMHLGIDEFTTEDVEAIETEDQQLNRSKGIWLYAYKNDMDVEEISDYYNNQVKYNYNPDFDCRDIVGDNYDDTSEKYYGNAMVKGPDASHGTHVAGIIGAKRGNGIGIDGIAENVKIMVLRCVPDGDERDKDIANSVIYAVDNGAKIINMSFGKKYSPQKEVVDKAFKYAEEKGVLLVHAAGNSSENNDQITHYPVRTLKDSKMQISSWIEVGALSWKKNNEMVAEFSNYGRKDVDLFAPGVDIYSSFPDDKYKQSSGTSMASPVVAGVAALVWSYYPSLTANELKMVLLDSSADYKKQKVLMPGKKLKKIKFKKLSNTGGVVNAYNALLLAEKISKK